MPESFRFPMNHQLWVPLRERPASAPGEGLGVRVVGRLADGVPSDEAHTELTAVGRRMTAAHPEAYERLQPEVVHAALMFVALPRGGIRALPAYYIVQALSLVLLVVACINVALLIFARTATRSSELAVRTALGASRGRIISQVFIECLVLAMVAAGFGLLLLGTLPRLLPAEMASALPYWIDFGLSARTVLFALLLAGFSAAAAGILPALKVTGRAVQRNIQQARANRSGIRFGGLSSALVAIDVAVAVGVVGFAVAVVDNLGEAWRAQTVSVGFPAEEYLSAQLFLPGRAPSADAGEYDSRAFAQRFGTLQQALVARLEAEPGVRRVAVADNLPRMEHPTARFDVEGDEDAGGENVVRVAKVARVDIGFFDALRVPVLAGRGFATSDLGENVSVGLVNESFVETVLGGRNPIGQRVRYRAWGADTTGWYEIVGVVGRAGVNIMQPDFDAGLYLPLVPGTIHPIRFAIHVGDDPESFTPRLREITAEVDANALIGSPLALNRVFEGDWYIAAAATLGGIVGLAILLALAGCGIYAIMSFSVAERTREIGIRTALGAQPGQVAWTVAKRSLMQLGIGAALGTPIAWWAFSSTRDETPGMAARFVASLLPGLAVMLVIGLAACTAPILRAMRVTPTEALKE
jgi:predicted permease